MNLTPQDIEAIERATLDAVPPEGTARMGRWLVAIDHGTVGRAHSAVPMDHASTDARVVGPIESIYEGNGLGTVFRVPVQRGFVAFRAELMARGYTRTKPTCTFTGKVSRMAELADGAAAQLMAQPDDDWRAVFLGEGFDPVDGASRVQILARAQSALFARVCVDGQTVAVGLGSFSRGWASVHGMRTLAPFRGRGFASQILGALAREAQRRDMAHAFLQVEAANTAAQALYRRAGFSLAWEYAYWSRPLQPAVPIGPVPESVASAGPDAPQPQ